MTDFGEFFNSLTSEEQVILLECALAGLNDEMTDGHLRENGYLDLDLSDEAIAPIAYKLGQFMSDDDLQSCAKGVDDV